MQQVQQPGVAEQPGCRLQWRRQPGGQREEAAAAAAQQRQHLGHRCSQPTLMQHGAYAAPARPSILQSQHTQRQRKQRCLASGSRSAIAGSAAIRSNRTTCFSAQSVGLYSLPAWTYSTSKFSACEQSGCAMEPVLYCGACELQLQPVSCMYFSTCMLLYVSDPTAQTAAPNLPACLAALVAGEEPVFDMYVHGPAA